MILLRGHHIRQGPVSIKRRMCGCLGMIGEGMSEKGEDCEYVSCR
jgi:hypothetical protein